MEGNTGNTGNTVVETYILREFFRRGIREHNVALIEKSLVSIFGGEHREHKG